MKTASPQLGVRFGRISGAVPETASSGDRFRVGGPANGRIWDIRRVGIDTATPGATWGAWVVEFYYGAEGSLEPLPPSLIAPNTLTFSRDQLCLEDGQSLWVRVLTAGSVPLLVVGQAVDHDAASYREL
jgi:hypothetical protein